MVFNYTGTVMYGGRTSQSCITPLGHLWFEMSRCLFSEIGSFRQPVLTPGLTGMCELEFFQDVYATCIADKDGYQQYHNSSVRLKINLLKKKMYIMADLTMLEKIILSSVLSCSDLQY